MNLSFFSLFLIFVYSSVIFAQTEEVKQFKRPINYVEVEHYEIGLSGGSFLPFGIVGVRDQYPSAGIWFSHPTAYGGIEYMLNSINAKSVTYYNGVLSLRLDFKAFDYADAYFRLGLDLHYYKRKPTLVREFDFYQTVGSHVGFGIDLQGKGPVALRSDFKFGFGPGHNLFVNLGIVYKWGANKDSEQKL